MALLSRKVGVHLGSSKRGSYSQKLLKIVNACGLCKVLVIHVLHFLSYGSKRSALSFQASRLVIPPPAVKHLCSDLSES